MSELLLIIGYYYPVIFYIAWSCHDNQLLSLVITLSNDFLEGYIVDVSNQKFRNAEVRASEKGEVSWLELMRSLVQAWDFHRS